MDNKRKKLKFAIIGSAKTYNTRDLIEEIRSRGHLFSTISAKDVFFDSSAGVLSIKEKINSFDIFFLRAGHDEYQKEVRMLARHLLDSKKIVVDEVLGKEYINGKMSQTLLFSKHDIPCPKTFLASSFASYKTILEKMRFPIIIKPDVGKRGIGIKKFESLRSALIFLRKNERGFILQEYLSTDGDIRAFVIGKKVVGTMKRYTIKGDYRSNVSLGARTEKMQFDSTINKLALKATRAIGLEIAGVDLIRHNGKYYVIEINEGPQWQGFKKTTGINPAKHIIEYAINKNNSQKQ